jgi:hypothetical protein
MPIYLYACPRCNAHREIHKPVARYDDEEYCECGAQLDIQLCAPMVIGDIAPYMAVAGDRAGKMINSRREHREFLKRNRLVEVGDAPVRDTKQTPKRIKKGEIRDELRKVIPQVLRR